MRFVTWLKRLFGDSDEHESPLPVLVDHRRTPRANPTEPCGVEVVQPEPTPQTPPPANVQWRTVHVPPGMRRMPTEPLRSTPVRGKRAPPPSILGNPWSNASVEDSRAKGYEKPSDHY